MADGNWFVSNPNHKALIFGGLFIGGFLIRIFQHFRVVDFFGGFHHLGYFRI
jgi:hypothetical protein